MMAMGANCSSFDNYYCLWSASTQPLIYNRFPKPFGGQCYGLMLKPRNIIFSFCYNFSVVVVSPKFQEETPYFGIKSRFF